MRFLIISIILLSVFYSHAQDCKGFIPYKTGTKWEITNYNAKGKPTGRIAYELKSKENNAEGLKYTVQMTSYDQKDNETFSNTFEAWCKNGVFEFDMKRFMSGESMQMFGNTDCQIDASEMEMPSMSAAAGTVLKDASLAISTSGGIGLNMTVDISDRKVEAKEKIETPAGVFDCIKISQLISTKMMVKIQAKSIEWYAEGVGMVASESYNKKGKLMGTSKLTRFEN
ncbi:hypothetical protein [uncultured Draconibacterium sp.]|uniref:TapB family protein n=1 Tax=uncultured Draconibacterium sp. TaxID=1573823 RepID=UPI0025DCDF85|nr:hypothetical protein [uncultured Draconibacterium sp.]